MFTDVNGDAVSADSSPNKLHSRVKTWENSKEPRPQARGSLHLARGNTFTPYAKITIR